jgi:hypothetical protein
MLEAPRHLQKAYASMMARIGGEEHVDRVREKYMEVLRERKNEVCTAGGQATALEPGLQAEQVSERAADPLEDRL